MRRFIPLVLLCSLQACNLNDFEGATTNGRSHQALIPSLRVRQDFGRTEGRSNIGLESSLDFADSDVALDQPGAGEVSFDMVQAFVGGRANLRFEPVEIGLLFGVANTNVRFDTGSLHESDNSFGGLLGIEIQWHPVPRFTPYVRGTYVFHDVGFRNDDYFPVLGYGNTTSSIEAGVKYHITDHVDTFLSVRRWRYHGVWNGGTWNGDEVDLVFEGVSIGMEFTF